MSDALCDLTTKVHRRPDYVNIPAPDYDGAVGNYYNSYHQDNHGFPEPPEEYTKDSHFVSKQFLRKNMSQEIKEISRDINMRSKQDIVKRPEFLAKQHQLKSSALKKQEVKDREENNELFSKLKSRSQVIEQDEKQKEEEENLPEFMKIKLKGKQPASTGSS